MLINDLDYLEVINSNEQVKGEGGFELIVAASTTNISGVYRGDGRVNGGIYGYARADLGSLSSSPYGFYEDEPRVYANSNAYFYAS